MSENRRDAWLALLGCAAIATALVIIWAARLSIPRSLYVSELGADGMPTEWWFMAALLCLVVGGSLVAWSGRHVRSEARVLSLWAPALSLWIACGLFLVASQVSCTPRCPVPYGPAFTWPDFIHTTAAVLAFALACWAMLQTAFARRHRMLAILSGVCAWSVGAIAGAGGLMSLFRFATELGAWCELIATTIAIAWVLILGIALAVERWQADRAVPATALPVRT